MRNIEKQEKERTNMINAISDVAAKNPTAAIITLVAVLLLGGGAFGFNMGGSSYKEEVSIMKQNISDNKKSAESYILSAKDLMIECKALNESLVKMRERLIVLEFKVDSLNLKVDELKKGGK